MKLISVSKYLCLFRLFVFVCFLVCGSFLVWFGPRATGIYREKHDDPSYTGFVYTHATQCGESGIGGECRRDLFSDRRSCRTWMCGEFVPVLPLSLLSKRVTLSNVPPFLSDEIITEALSCYGKLVSPIKKIPISTGSPLLKHIVSFRRFAYMIIQDDGEQDLKLSFRADEFDYIIFVTTAKTKCFGCGKTGHLIRNCSEKKVTEEGDMVSNPSVSREAGIVSLSSELQGDHHSGTEVVICKKIAGIKSVGATGIDSEKKDKVDMVSDVKQSKRPEKAREGVTTGIDVNQVKSRIDCVELEMETGTEMFKMFKKKNVQEK